MPPKNEEYKNHYHFACVTRPSSLEFNGKRYFPPDSAGSTFRGGYGNVRHFRTESGEHSVAVKRSNIEGGKIRDLRKEEWTLKAACNWVYPFETPEICYFCERQAEFQLEDARLVMPYYPMQTLWGYQNGTEEQPRKGLGGPILCLKILHVAIQVALYIYSKIQRLDLDVWQRNILVDIDEVSHNVRELRLIDFGICAPYLLSKDIGYSCYALFLIEQYNFLYSKLISGDFSNIFQPIASKTTTLELFVSFYQQILDYNRVRFHFDGEENLSDVYRAAGFVVSRDDGTQIVNQELFSLNQELVIFVSNISSSTSNNDKRKVFGDLLCQGELYSYYRCHSILRSAIRIAFMPRGRFTSNSSETTSGQCVVALLSDPLRFNFLKRLLFHPKPIPNPITYPMLLLGYIETPVFFSPAEANREIENSKYDPCADILLHDEQC